MVKEMAYPPGMELHGAGWRITKRIPKALLSHYTPNTRLRFQTGEADKKAATVLAWRWLAERAEEFQRIRDTGSKYRQDITPEESAHLVRLMVCSSLAADEAGRDAGDYQDDASFQRSVARMDEVEQENRTAIARRVFGGDLPDIVGDWLDGHGYDIPRDSETFQRLCLEFAKGRAEALKVKHARNAGDWIDTPPLPVLTPPPVKEETLTLSDVISHFLKKQPQDAPMFKKSKGATDLLLEVLGDRPVATLKQKEIDDFFGLLCRLPPRWSDKKRQLKKSAAELAEMSWPICLNQKTFEDSYMAALRPFFKDASRVFGDSGWPRYLTTDGIKYTGNREGGENKQRSMRPEELRRLFEGSEFAAFAGDAEKEHCYWFPLVGLYTGARVNEVCQLNPQCDIKEEGGIWFFDITEDTETDERVKKSVKNKPSIRRTPIHSALLDLGLLAYVERMKAQGHVLLFPQWPPTRKKASGKAEKWFRELLKTTNLRDETPGKRIVGFHCLRSTFLTRADHLDIPKPGTLTGHSQGDQSNRDEDGYKDPIELGKNRDKMERMSYEVSIPPLPHRAACRPT